MKLMSLFLVCLFFVACADEVYQYNIKYEVTGTATSVVVSYQNVNGGMTQVTTVLPWSHTFVGKHGETYYCSVQNQGVVGNILLKYIKDNVVVIERFAEGNGVVVTVNGTIE